MTRAIIASKSGTMQGVQILKETRHTYTVRNWSEQREYKVSKKDSSRKVFIAGTYSGVEEIETWIKS